MSRKNFIVKRIVVAVIMACSMTMSSFAAGRYDISADNPNITINRDEQGEADVSRLGVSGLKYSLDQLYGVKRQGNVVVGVPFNKGMTLYDGLKNADFMKMYSSKKNELIKAVRLAYPKETNQWYDEYIALPIYYGVLNGYEDGTLKPNNPVKVGEVAKIVSTAYETGITSNGYLSNSKFNSGKGLWYNNYYNKIAKAFTYTSSTKMMPAYMESNMRRCEVAYVLASVCNDGTLNNYIAKAEKGDISQMAGYTDFKNVVKTDGVLTTEQTTMKKGQIPARFAGAIMYLQAKGIMVGDGAGHINPLDNVTRAEVFKLIQTTCQKTASYTKNKFYGWETKASSGGGTTTQKPAQTQMTVETVLNPNAPAELQYKVKHINENSYDYILDGTANIAKKQLNKEYTKPIVDQVKASVKFNNGSTTITIPDLKSEYHEVVVKYYKNVNGNMQGMKVYRGSQQSGTINLEGDCYMISIGVEGRKDKATDPGASSYTQSYSIESEAWETY